MGRLLKLQMAICVPGSGEEHAEGLMVQLRT
jgi:hypothetical protein